MVEFVDGERNVVTEYETAPKTGSVARRREGEMVARFEDHLRAAGHVVKRVRIRAPGESQTLVTDTYDVTTGTLYEAKSSVTRPTVRLAVGQLLDYKRFVPSTTKLALLLPALVSPDLYAYVGSCEMRITYQDEDGWAVQSS